MKPVHVGRAVEREAGEEVVASEARRSGTCLGGERHRRADRVVAAARQARASGSIGHVGEDWPATGELDAVVARAGIHPHTLGDGGPDLHLIVASEGIDDDREEVVFGGQ